MTMEDFRHDGKIEIRVNTDSPELVCLAWSRAADAITRWPPECPVLNPSISPMADVLRRIWPDWVRILTNFAVRFSDEMEKWATSFVSGSVDDIESGVLAVLKRWNHEYPVDLWSVHQRALGEVKPGHAQPYWESRLQWDSMFGANLGPGEFVSFIPEAHDTSGWHALASIFAWRRGVSTTSRPGFLEARWVQWPRASEPLLCLHLSHPKLPFPEAPVSRSAHQIAGLGE
jgi:hypothetical protein